jgi:putative ABC transport system permease protein
LSAKLHKYKLMATIAVRRYRQKGWITAVQLLVLALSVSMLMAMPALNRELTTGPSRYLETLDVDYWVTQESADSLASSSFVDQSVVDELKASDLQVDSTFVYFGKVDDRQVLFQSYDSEAGVLNPQLNEGRHVTADNEVVLDHVLANGLDVTTGDTITFNQQDWLIVGLSRETNSIAKETIFISHDAMTSLTGTPVSSAVAIKLQPGQNWGDGGFTGHQVVTHDEFVASNIKYWEDSISLFVQVIIGVALLGALLGLALLLRLQITSRNRENALLRAVAATVKEIRTMELAFSAILFVLVAIMALPMAMVVLTLANMAPGTTAALTSQDVQLGLGIFIAASALATFGPLRRLKKLSPVDQLRAA